MPTLLTLLLLAAFVIFTIAAVRAVIVNKKFDYTNSGLACIALAMLAA